MNLTYKEQERLAYISGDTQKAALYGALADAWEDIGDLQDENADLRTYGGYEDD